jgi:SET domain-containing protein
MKLTADSRFAIRRSLPGVGEGLFAVNSIAAGEFVLEYTGERIPTGTAEDAGSRYLFVVDDEWTIDGPVPENTAGFINHACEPNCEATVEEGRILIYATRDIGSGEELTIDYGEEYFKKFIEPVGCKCETCLNSS